MRVSYFAAALLPLVMASPFGLEARADGAATVLKDLQKVDSDIKAQNNSLNAFGDNTAPTTAQIVALQSATNKLTKDVKATTKAAQASSTFTKAESASIYNYIANTIQPDVISILQNFIDHEPAFAADDADPTIKKGLTQQKALVQAQAKALTAKSVAPYNKEGTAITNNLVAKFNQAIAAYS